MNNTKRKSALFRERIFVLVEVTGLEPAASASRTQRSTKLSHTSLLNFICHKLTFCYLFALLRSFLLRCPKNYLPWSVKIFRPRRLFVLAYSATGSARTQSYQTEPHLVIKPSIDSFIIIYFFYLNVNIFL